MSTQTSDHHKSRVLRAQNVNQIPKPAQRSASPPSSQDAARRATATKVATLLRRLAAYQAALVTFQQLATQQAQEDLSYMITDTQSQDLAEVVAMNEQVCNEFLYLVQARGDDSKSRPQDFETSSTNDKANVLNERAPWQWQDLAQVSVELLRVLNTILQTVWTDQDPKQRFKADWGEKRDSASRVYHTKESTNHKSNRKSVMRAKRSTRDSGCAKTHDTDSDDGEGGNHDKTQQKHMAQENSALAMLASTAVATALVGYGSYQSVQAHQQGQEYNEFADSVHVTQTGDGIRVNGDYTWINATNTGKLAASDAAEIVKALKAEGVNVEGHLARTSTQVFRISKEMEFTLNNIAGCLEVMKRESQSKMYSAASLAGAGVISLAQLYVLRTSMRNVLRTFALSGGVSALLLGVYAARFRQARIRSLRTAAQVRAFLLRLKVMQENIPTVRQEVIRASQSFRNSNFFPS